MPDRLSDAPRGTEILCGDAVTRLTEMPAGSAQCCVTSPPYFGLRDYGQDGQLGLESTPDEYVANLVAVFREVKRVLRDDGTLWLNLGDSYAGSNQNGGSGAESISGAKPKDLLGIPWMVAFALRADGWYLRSEIIWAKPNPMPESVTDRPTKAHEQVFLLSKSARYFYDAEAIREAPTSAEQTAHNERYAREYEAHTARAASGNGIQPGNNGNQGIHSRPGKPSANKRSVWTVATQPYPEAHFATFPPKMIEPMILAGCPREACGVCGAPWERQIEREAMVVAPSAKRAAWQASDDHARTQVGGTMLSPPTSMTVGFAPTCEHNDRSGAGVVLDPFAGSGTTLQVALANGRGAVGIELNPEYVRLIEQRLRGVTPSMFDAGAACA